MILCENGSFYTGYTRDVDERMKLHFRGKGARYTRMHKPQKLVYVEQFTSRSKAMKRERLVKTMGRRQKLELISSTK